MALGVIQPGHPLPKFCMEVSQSLHQQKWNSATLYAKPNLSKFISEVFQPDLLSKATYKSYLFLSLKKNKLKPVVETDQPHFISLHNKRSFVERCRSRQDLAKRKRLGAERMIWSGPDAGSLPSPQLQVANNQAVQCLFSPSPTGFPPRRTAN
ncbi:UNVERIFIED_CONTAM: hypothetical protein K2H54_040410 [Gekko kuhli]